MKKLNYRDLTAGALTLIASALRLYRLPEFITFLGDQGRDAIIVKRIITFEHLPAIGAPSSVGGIYLGPFYYYLVSPFLLLFRLNPVGLGYGVALLTIVLLIVIYILLRKEHPWEAVGVIFFTTFSYVNIELARFSWNPNLLPLFAMLTIIFFYRMLKYKTVYWAILFGLFFGMCIQLHYLSAFLIPTFTVGLIYYITAIDKKKTIVTHARNVGISIVSFLICISPLVIFDLRHQFLNLRNLITYLTHGEQTLHTPFLNRLTDTCVALLNYSFGFTVPPVLAFIVYVVLFGLLVYSWKNRHLLSTLTTLNVFLFLLTFSIIQSQRHPHYYGPVYLSLFYTIAALLTAIKNRKIQLTLVSIVGIVFLVGNLSKLSYLTSQGSNQITKARTLADTVAPLVTSSQYQIVSLPATESNEPMRYFLEINHKTPFAMDSAEQPDELFVLCYQQPCEVLENKQWNISIFKNATIGTQLRTDGVTIYKLIHKP